MDLNLEGKSSTITTSLSEFWILKLINLKNKITIHRKRRGKFKFSNSSTLIEDKVKKICLGQFGFWNLFDD